MNRWRNQTDGSEVLVWVRTITHFRFRLRRTAQREWYFDSAAGKDEILSRRIGENELAVIDVLAAMADAQAQYFSQAHGGVKQYAQKFISDEGTQDGLYWKSAEGEPKSPLGPGVVGLRGRIRSAGGEAATISRLLLSRPHPTGRRRQRRREELHSQRQDEREASLSLPTPKNIAIPASHIHHESEWGYLRKRPRREL